ncbi:MAG: MFS transporter, partial [Sulfurovum sp.]|nr:MFS transporter [Sulfurovum sp.]
MFKQILPLSSIVGLRFFGLFVVLPVLSSYAIGLDGANAMLAGIVMGGYAITQAIFQVPFGHLSDRIGRKNAILIGSVIFLIGSVVSAISTDIYMLMLGRFLQGTGAVGAVVSAMISDLVREEQRSHAMAMMGGTIAMSFVAAMIISPLMSGVWGVPGLFWLTAALTVATIIMLYTIIPESPKIIHTFSEEEKGLKGVLADKQLGKMYITFLSHSTVM